MIDPEKGIKQTANYECFFCGDTARNFWYDFHEKWSTLNKRLAMICRFRCEFEFVHQKGKFLSAAQEVWITMLTDICITNVGYASVFTPCFLIIGSLRSFTLNNAMRTFGKRGLWTKKMFVVWVIKIVSPICIFLLYFKKLAQKHMWMLRK